MDMGSPQFITNPLKTIWSYNDLGMGALQPVTSGCCKILHTHTQSHDCILGTWQLPHIYDLLQCHITAFCNIFFADLKIFASFRKNTHLINGFRHITA